MSKLDLMMRILIVSNIFGIPQLLRNKLIEDEVGIFCYSIAIAHAAVAIDDDPIVIKEGSAMAVDRVLLRPLRKEDSPLLYSWITNRELVVLNAPFHPISEVDHQAWFESMLIKRADLVIFVIEDATTNQAIGTCQLTNINWLHRNAELQIRIGNFQYHGRGVGSEAVRLLTHFGFADLNLHRIYLNVFASNTRAIKAYEKCGFLREALLKDAVFIDGSWVDVVGMSKLNKND